MRVHADGLGDRLHRHLAARPGARTRASPRSRPTGSGSTRRTSTCIHGDTDQGPWGWDTYGSRSLAVGGEAVARGGAKVVRTRPSGSARALLEAAPEDIELARRQVPGARLAGQGDDDGRDRRRGAHPAERAARRTSSRGSRRPRSTTRRTSSSRSARTHAWSTWTRRPARSKVVRYVAVDDCGPAINPMLIDGQVHGGIAHAIGQALYEQVVYDEDGQLVTGTFVDYALPTRRRAARRSRPTAPRRRRRSTRSASRASARPARSRAIAGGHRPRCIDALEPLGVDRTRHAADARCACGRRSSADGRRRCGMIPAAFDYAAPDIARRGDPAAARERRGRQAARRRPLAAAADEAAAGGADAARRPAPACPACTASSRTTAAGGSAR